ncbi:MAG: VOC family protein [Leptolyngbya sp. UWPOB_LEPTO1]|uniref:VOC family protein n=1 Tax=Leptolyngbya sp. UWPOB_LEPTO1 TaxID=2815653 RepID=UPI001AD44C07|nr:VOC family protein [Leptolyngbya sp. UWPOB_LEPTO1]MBN8561461.1 VOC family protein [Leptolyngbya sp. UWPOB_LEPTO1]
MITGIYDVCIGVSDIDSAIAYWQQFGYSVDQTGSLSAESAQRLYQSNSALHSVRLTHQTADHGLIRLMQWEHPRNEGLGLASMRVRGNRWATTMTADVLTILNQAEEADRAGFPIRYTMPYWEIIYNKDRKMRPFLDDTIGVREALLLQPLTRQVLFQRFGYSVPNYGQINEQSAFKASQVTHMGMIVQDDSKETIQFYEDVLGLLRVRDDVETFYEFSEAGRVFFDLQPGEKFIVTAFDDPRSSVTDWQAARSGRLYIVRFPEAYVVPEQFEKAQPGCLGMSLYTYRVGEVEEYRDRIQASSARNVTEICVDEFGDRSFSFTAPDGYFWTLIES